MYLDLTLKRTVFEKTDCIICNLYSEQYRLPFLLLSKTKMIYEYLVSMLYCYNPSSWRYSKWAISISNQPSLSTNQGQVLRYFTLYICKRRKWSIEIEGRCVVCLKRKNWGRVSGSHQHHKVASVLISNINLRPLAILFDPASHILT